MKQKNIFLFLGISLVVIGLFTIVEISNLTLWASSFAEKYASVDHSLTSSSKVRIAISILTSALIVIIFGILFLASREEPSRSSIQQAVQDIPLHATEKTKLKPPGILVFTTILTSLFIILYIWRVIDPRLDELYVEGGLVESLTAIAFSISSVFIYLAIRARLQGEKKIENPKKWWLIPYLSIMLGFFVLFMEEINWGQAYLGWKTPESFAEFNRQGETNLHNIVETFELLYYPLALLFPLELLSGWLGHRIDMRSVVLRILPRPNTLFLAAVLSALAFIAVGINEFVEQLFAFFTLVYSYQLYFLEKQHQA